MTLHILSKSPQHNAYKSCLEHIAPHDVVMLINDGVYALKAANAQLLGLMEEKRLFALQQDAVTRGVTAPAEQLIDEAGFVSLTCQHTPSQSWF